MLTPTIQVLFIEDNPDDMALVVQELRRGGYEVECIRVENAEAMTHNVKAFEWDLIIADYRLPQFNGLDAFRIYREAGLDTPFIIVSGSIGEDIAVEAMKSGVHDYILKSNLIRLVPAVRRELAEAEERRARREAEEKLRQSESLRRIGELTASLIHDLKNPLQAILSAGEILSSEKVRPEQKVKFGNMIEGQIRRILNMSDEILEFARGSTTISKAPCHLPEFIEEIGTSFSKAFLTSGVEFEWSVDTNSLMAETAMLDRERLWRAVQNLLTNAKDATPEGGKVHLVLTASEKNVIIRVKDTGRGVPVEIQDRLFDPLVTHGKKHGTGLGLAIVKRIVELHGGTIGYESEPGIGSTFEILLPWDESVPTRKMAEEEPVADPV